MVKTATTGHNMKLYRNTGTYGTPVLSLIGGIADLSVPSFDAVAAEVKRRGNNFTKAVPGVFNLIAVEGRLVYGVETAVFDALRANFLSQTAEEWVILRDVQGTGGVTNEGLRVPILLEAFPWDQPIDDAAGFDVRGVCAFYISEGSAEDEPGWWTFTD